MNDLNKKNFIWSTLGSLVYGFTSLFIMIIITRINGLEMAGYYTYAFAVVSLLWSISAYAGKVFQVTETNKKIKDSDFIYNKFYLNLIMYIVAAIYCLIIKPKKIELVFIILLLVYRSVDNFIDCIHAIVQKNGELYKVGISMFIRTISLIGTFLLIDILTKNVILSCLFFAITNIFYCIFVDYSLIKNKHTKGHYSKENNYYILKNGFLIFVYYFFISILVNMTKYSVNKFEPATIQAIYGIIIMPASFLSLISSYIVQPFLNTFKQNAQNKKYDKLFNQLLKIIFIMLSISILAIIVCYFIGIPVLNLVYDVNIDNQLTNLIIILIGSMFYSMAFVCSSIAITLRKSFEQLVMLIISVILGLIICDKLVCNYGLSGASISYLFIMIVVFFLHFILVILILKKKDKKVTIRLMGGLGNQMFEYSALRVRMIEEGRNGRISLKGITNKTHNVYSLDKFTINEDIEITEKESFKSFINYLIYGFYCVFLVKRKNGFKIMQKLEKILNYFGFINVPDGYIEINNSDYKNVEMLGYFQSINYFKKYKDVIKKELKIKNKIEKKNLDLYKEICNSNSVCLHIRRGDYVGSNHQVCTDEYYYNAIKLMNKKVKNPVYFVFSDDIKWLKENMKLDKNIVYVDKNNNNYEELRLMYSCKHFIISNSSFSWWAQFLTDNEKRITIAPSKWFNNPNQKVDIYEDDWILIDV